MTSAEKPCRRHIHACQLNSDLLIHGIFGGAGATLPSWVWVRESSYDNADTEALNSPYKHELVWHDAPWKGRVDPEIATARWVDCYNRTRVHLTNDDDLPPNTATITTTPPPYNHPPQNPGLPTTDSEYTSPPQDSTPPPTPNTEEAVYLYIGGITCA